ncbi:helix-turn-helix domain-containing protein [Raineyella sp. LH-20]|uniref:helix-turn-helix domain-containing protein n=1 Tax=Raineyella sp. LH-20 TaxID=3081204 RepID=UPI002955B0CF|nr:helix-turn-helix domain-containing protein [Raineyella sp. LH-20]WOP18139.1 helix-turn-helix domain-containing protein [Raineyella sp. LH-20]
MTELLTTADVATILQVSPQRVRSLARDGVLPAVRDEGGSGWLFRADGVQEYQEHRSPRRGPGPRGPQGVPDRSPAVRGGGQAASPRSEELAALQVENEELRAEVARLRAQCQDLSAHLQRSRSLSEVLVRELG